MAKETEKLVSLLKQKSLTITTAESCTGGMISSEITKIPGVSQHFNASFVTYSNEAKMKYLSVSKHSLSAHGAVSEEVVLEMAEGALQAGDADFSIAISGIAGPTGGTEVKPVGTVFIGFATQKKKKAFNLHFKGSREGIRKKSVLWAIKEAVVWLENEFE